MGPIQKLKNAKRWVLVAGPPLTPGQFHCATIPDSPNCQWKDGEYERIEAKNRRAAEAHFANLAKECFIQPNHLPANIQDGYRPKYRALKAGRERHTDEIRDRVARDIPFNDPDAASRGLPDPIIPGISYGRVEKATAQRRAVQLPDDLSILVFLASHEPAPSRPLAVFCQTNHQHHK